MSELNKDAVKIALIISHPYSLVNFDMPQNMALLERNRTLWEAFNDYKRFLLFTPKFDNRNYLSEICETALMISGDQDRGAIDEILDFHEKLSATATEPIQYEINKSNPAVSKLAGDLRRDGVKDIVFSGGNFGIAPSTARGCLRTLIEEYFSDDYFRCWLVGNCVSFWGLMIDSIKNVKDNLIKPPANLRVISLEDICQQGVHHFYHETCLGGD